jgi:hypothetical protein
MSSKHGEQFSADRYCDADDDLVPALLAHIFRAHNIVATEPDQPYDNFADEKRLHQLIDYGGSDYVVDQFASAPFGINHRTHAPRSPDETLRWDIRADTGTQKPSEFDELLADGGKHAMVPRWATRMRASRTQAFEWLRVVDLRAFRRAVGDGLEPVQTWTDEVEAVTAHLYAYDDLLACDALAAEYRPTDVADQIDLPMPDITHEETTLTEAEFEQVQRDQTLQVTDFVRSGGDESREQSVHDTQ